MGTFMEYFNAFWVGGSFVPCARFCSTARKCCREDYGNACVHGRGVELSGTLRSIAEYAGAGASVPLLGFGHLLFQGVKDAVKESGFLGLFQGGLKAGAVGTSAALIFAYLASWIFQPKMKK